MCVVIICYLAVVGTISLGHCNFNKNIDTIGPVLRWLTPTIGRKMDWLGILTERITNIKRQVARK